MGGGGGEHSPPFLFPPSPLHPTASLLTEGGARAPERSPGNRVPGGDDSSCCRRGGGRTRIADPGDTGGRRGSTGGGRGSGSPPEPPRPGSRPASGTGPPASSSSPRTTSHPSALGVLRTLTSPNALRCLLPRENLLTEGSGSGPRVAVAQNSAHYPGQGEIGPEDPDQVLPLPVPAGALSQRVLRRSPISP